jgi:hypothetical protein
MSLRRMISSTDMTDASDVAFNSELMELPSGGIIRRKACGSVIGDRIGLSATPCWRANSEARECRLHRRVALLDPEKPNLGVSVFIAVKTNQHNAEWVDRFRKIVNSLPEVVDFFVSAATSTI